MPLEGDRSPHSVSLIVESRSARVKLPGLECTFDDDVQCKVLR